MHVYFSALVTFTENISVKFWRKLRKDCTPFVSLDGSGGPKGAQFSGVLVVEADAPDDVLSYQITEALVTKVELLSDVGVAHIEFHEVTRGIDAPPQKTRWTEEELRKMPKRELQELLSTRFGYKDTKRMTKDLLVDSVVYAQREAEVQARVRSIVK